jgi:hypothetical protein
MSYADHDGMQRVMPKEQARTLSDWVPHTPCGRRRAEHAKKCCSRQNQDDDTTLEYTRYHIFRNSLNSFSRAQTSYWGVPGGSPAGGAYDVEYSGTLPTYLGGAGYCYSSAGGGLAGCGKSDKRHSSANEGSTRRTGAMYAGA